LINSIRIKLLVAYLILIAVCVLLATSITTGMVSHFVVPDMEEAMVDKAVLLATLFPQTTGDKAPSHAQLQSLQNYVHQTAPEIRCRIRMTDANGQVLVDSALTKPLPGNTVADKPEIKLALAGKYGARMRHDPEAPREYLSMFVAHPVRQNNRVVGVVYLSCTLRHITKLLTNLNHDVHMAALAALLGGALISILLAMAFARPIRELQRAARQLAAGDWSARAKVRSRDELGQLACAFNEMADRLAELENLRRDYLSDISHELRTPLSAIKGFTETLLDAAADDPAVRRDYLRRIAVKTEQINRMVEDLLDLARLEAGAIKLDFQNTALAPIGAEVVDTFRWQAEEKGIKLYSEIAEDLPELFGSTQRLQQVLENLVSNALRATAHGGEVKISAEKADGCVAISVADTGRGMAPEHLTRIFNRFYRVVKPGERSSLGAGGAGLGLAIVKQIIETHGGQIEVASEPGRGTTFRFTIPTAV
jgi:signal transduction histidine kinase